MSARLPDAPDDGPVADLVRARRGGELSALDRLLLHSPPVAEGWNSLLGALRQHTSLPADLTELVVLRVAVLNDAEFEWVAHEPVGRRAGLTEEQLAALRTPDPSAAFTGRQALALRATDASTRDVVIGDELFAELRSAFDERELVELLVTIGGYAMVSRFLVALQVPPPAGEVAG